MPATDPRAAEDRDLLKAAVREAGAIALSLAGEGLRHWAKEDMSPVSEADLAVNDFLHRALIGARPGYGWLSEETEDNPARMSAERIFVVDPIDGTRAFLRGRPSWSISVAVVADGQPVAAAVFNPVTGEMFEAAARGGAHLNSHIISPTAHADLEGCAMLAAEDVIRSSRWRDPWPPMAVTYHNSMAYRLCLVAAGVHDACIALAGKGDWDLAAAHLIAAEAGAIVSDHQGGTLTYNGPVPRQPSVLAAGPVLHRQIVERTRHFRARKPGAA